MAIVLERIPAGRSGLGYAGDLVITIDGLGDLAATGARRCSTSVDAGHSHVAVVDAGGTGSTTVAAGHRHAVVAGQVQPAGDGHGHALGRCGPA